MRARRETNKAEQEVGGTHKRKQPTEQGPTFQSRPVHQIALQRAIQDPRTIPPEAVLQLQGKIGNQVMSELIAQRKQSEGASGASIQRTETEEKASIEGKPIREVKNHVRTHPDSSQTSEEHEELVQAKSSIQAELQEEQVHMQPAVEEIQTKGHSGYRHPEEETLQTEPGISFGRRASAPNSGAGRQSRTHELSHAGLPNQGGVMRTKPPMQRPTHGDTGFGTEPAVTRAEARLGSNSPTKSRLATPQANVVQRLFYEKTDPGVLIWHNERADPANWVALDEWVPSKIPLVKWRVYRRKARDLEQEAVEKLRGMVEGEAPITGSDKRNYDKACWSWALHGFKPSGVFPQHVFHYLRAKMQPESVAGQTWHMEDVPENQGRGWIEEHQGALDRIADEWRGMGGAVHGPGRSRVDHPAVVKAVRLIAQANGLELAGKGARADYYLCMHYTVADGVTFDHWWLEVEGATIETFPSQDLDIQIYKGKQDDAGKREVRLPLVRLLPAHVDKVHNVLRGSELPE